MTNVTINLEIGIATEEIPKLMFALQASEVAMHLANVLATHCNIDAIQVRKIDFDIDVNKSRAEL